MGKEMKKYKSLILPIAVISLYLAFLIIVRESLPSSKDLVSYLSSIYGRYGYEIVFLGSLLEAVVLVNFFVPGAAAMGLGAVFARSGQLDLTVAILTATGGAIIGYTLDFALGFWGFSALLEKTAFGKDISKLRQNLERSRLRTLSLSFIHPNIGSFGSLAAGTLKMHFVKFLPLSAFSTVFWYSLWGILVFVLGEIFLIVLTRYAFVLILLAVSFWILRVLFTKKA